MYLQAKQATNGKQESEDQYVAQDRTAREIPKGGWEGDRQCASYDAHGSLHWERPVAMQGLCLTGIALIPRLQCHAR